ASPSSGIVRLQLQTNNVLVTIVIRACAFLVPRRQELATRPPRLRSLPPRSRTERPIPWKRQLLQLLSIAPRARPLSAARTPSRAYPACRPASDPLACNPRYKYRGRPSQ